MATSPASASDRVLTVLAEGLEVAMPGRGAPSGVDARRAAGVLLLVVIAAVGLRAGGAFSAAGSHAILGMSGQVLYWALAVTEAILFVAGLILFAFRLIWLRKAGHALPERKRRSIWWLLLLPFMVYGLTRTIAVLRAHGIGPHRASHGAAHTGGGGAVHHTGGSSWPVLVLFIVVALGAAAITVYRRRRYRVTLAERGPVPAPEPLAEALAAGAQALREDPDPRTAIIACYAAMERSLANAGSPADAADTPAEVLARATAGGLVSSSCAGTLTGLFRRARYSRHPMTEDDRTTAMEALAQVRADLGETAGVGQT
jgi:hypothetical protein